MKTIQLSKTSLVTTALLMAFVASASIASAATYSYVNTQGNIQTVEAASAQAALNAATNIAAHSGVIEGDLTKRMTTSPSPTMTNAVPMTDTAAADLRVGLNALMKEHVNLGLSALFNVIEENEATAGSVAALDENSVELAATVGSVYGDDAEDAFLQIWRDHIGFFANYAVGLRTDDEDMRLEAEADLQTYQTDIATFFNSALPMIQKSTVIAGAGEHKRLLLEAMDEYHEGNYEAAYMAQREADKQISGIANLLAKEIVAQNQSSF